MTTDTEFILDLIPGRPSLIVGAGFSGHGFKLAPVVGRVRAQLAEGGKEALDEEMRGYMPTFSIERPEVATRKHATEFPFVTQLEEEELVRAPQGGFVSARQKL